MAVPGLDWLRARLDTADAVSGGYQADMGHPVRPVSGLARGIFGDGQIIRRDAETGVLFGGSDPRKDGQVAAW